MTTDEILKAHQQAELMVSPAEVQAAYDKLAEELNRDYADKTPLIVTIMNGGLIPAGQLLPRLTMPLEMTYLHASRYQNKTRGYELQWFAKPQESLAGRDVIIVDDIFDEGYTLMAVQQFCQAQHVASLATAVLVNKIHDRKAEGISVDYIGLDVEDFYIYGEGMDYKGFYRNLPGLYKASVF